jgi:hypothetical protein
MTRDEEHRLWHERRYMFNAAFILLDLLLAPIATMSFAFGDPSAAIVFLAPALPLAVVAIADWIASGRSYAACTCKWKFTPKS